MNVFSAEALQHKVTYRFVGGKPEDGILSCGLMHKKTTQKSQIDFIIPYYSCFVLLDGSGKYWDETGISVPLRAGSVVQRLPGRVHSTQVDGDGHWTEFYISFGRCVFDSMKALGLLQDDVPVVHSPDPEKQMPVFLRLLEQMSAVPDSMLMPCLQEAQQIAHGLTCEIQTDERSPLIKQACSILENDFARELSLQEMAGRLCIGYETFRKQFRKEMGISPDEYRQNRRMSTAQMMLMEGEPIKSVARALGYSDSYAFSKQFKRFCGSAPGTYIQRFSSKG